MVEIFCLWVILLLTPLLLITLGLVNIFKKDWAWVMAEFLMRNVRPQRTPEWERTATINGVMMLLAGLVLLVYSLNAIRQMAPSP